MILPVAQVGVLGDPVRLQCLIHTVKVAALADLNVLRQGQALARGRLRLRVQDSLIELVTTLARDLVLAVNSSGFQI